MRTYVRMIVCVHIPRFELSVAAGEGARVAQQTLAGRALAVAPLVGGEQRVGEVSGAAEACGVARGMVLGEALARCPDLVLVPGDPVAVAEAWERALCALEAIGAAVEPARPGLAYFESGGLRGIHGTAEATIAAASRALARSPVPRMGARADALLRAGGRDGGALAPPARDRRPAHPRGPAAGWPGAGRAARLPRGHGGADRAADAPGRAHARRARAARAPGAERPLRRRGRSPIGWPAARTARCARAASRSAWRSRWRSATRARARR
jgi:hypothetical protein